jgi:hypothetical protein
MEKKIVRVNSRNVIATLNEVADLKKNATEFSGKYFQVSECSNSSDLLVRMSSGEEFFNPWMRLTFTSSNYKFRKLFVRYNYLMNLDLIKEGVK